MDGKDISAAIRYTRMYVRREPRWQVVPFSRRGHAERPAEDAIAAHFATLCVGPFSAHQAPVAQSARPMVPTALTGDTSLPDNDAPVSLR
jgi:hypothetical protein